MNKSRNLAAAGGGAAALGFVAGLRSQMPLAALSLAMVRGGRGGFLGNRFVASGLCLAALGEMVGDKLPVTPSRLQPGSLGGRLMFGTLAAALLSRQMSSPAVFGATLGASGALVGSYAGYHSRASLTRVTGAPDAVWAVAEDTVAAGLGILAARTLA